MTKRKAQSEFLTWEEKLILLRGYVAEHKKMPSRSTTYLGFNLGFWVGNQRQAKTITGRGRLTADRIAALEKVKGWQWEVCRSRHKQWQSQLRLLREFVETHQRLPRDEEKFRNESLGAWVAMQRRRRRSFGRLSPAHVAELNAIPGWYW